MSTRASVQSMRMASCSAGISSEKTAAFFPARMAAFSMKFMPILVLPMDGRPATSTSSSTAGWAANRAQLVSNTVRPSGRQ